MSEFVQTERLSKSIFFNRLKVGVEVFVLDVPRKKLPPNADYSKHGQLATIVRVPVYPSTWLTAKLAETSQLVKVRTSQVAFTEKAPAPTEKDLQEALARARNKAARASQQSRKHASESGKRKRRGKKGEAQSTQGSPTQSSPTANSTAPDPGTPLSQTLQQQQQHASVAAAAAAAQYGMLNPDALAAMVGTGQYPMSGGPAPQLMPYGFPYNISQLSQFPFMAGMPGLPGMVSRPGWRPSASHPHGGAEDMTTSKSSRRADDPSASSSAANDVRLEYCGSVVLPTLINHRLSWPFLSPIAQENLEKFETARQLQMAYNDNSLVNFNVLHERLQSGYYHDAMDVVRDLRRLFSHCYSRFAGDSNFVELVIELEIVLDDCLTRMPKVPSRGDVMSAQQAAMQVQLEQMQQMQQQQLQQQLQHQQQQQDEDTQQALSRHQLLQQYQANPLQQFGPMHGFSHAQPQGSDATHHHQSQDQQAHEQPQHSPYRNLPQRSHTYGGISELEVAQQLSSMSAHQDH
eukprot:m.56165 g.56165  ORF g.56165 m.56165 type:complete len:518 (-) comp11545_c0_seq1:503-2056(-)